MFLMLVGTFASAYIALTLLRLDVSELTFFLVVCVYCSNFCVFVYLFLRKGKQRTRALNCALTHYWYKVKVIMTNSPHSPRGASYKRVFFHSY